MEWQDKEAFIQKMNKLKRVYDSYLNEWRIELEKYMRNVGTWTADDITQMQTLVHKLSGTGSTYGYSNVTDAARSLEYKLAYASVEFKAGSSDPNKNAFIINELRNLIRVCASINELGEVSRMERERFGDDDEVMDIFDETKHDGKTILVVDDQDIIRDTLSAGLKSAGFNVLVAVDGDDALLKMQKLVPDLIILDRMMPHLDGLTVLKTMRKVKNLVDVPVIFLTALYSPAHVLEASTLGVVDYVAKPFDTDEFVMRCLRFFQPTKKFGKKAE